MRYVLELNNEYVRFIQWTAGVSPLLRLVESERARIYDDEELNYVIKRAGSKTRRELIEKKYPGIKFKKVNVTF